MAGRVIVSRMFVVRLYPLSVHTQSSACVMESLSFCLLCRALASPLATYDHIFIHPYISVWLPRWRTREDGAGSNLPPNLYPFEPASCGSRHPVRGGRTVVLVANMAGWRSRLGHVGLEVVRSPGDVALLIARRSDSDSGPPSEDRWSTRAPPTAERGGGGRAWMIRLALACPDPSLREWGDSEGGPNRTVGTPTPR